MTSQVTKENMKKVFTGYSDTEVLFRKVKEWCDEKVERYTSPEVRRYDADELTIVVEIIDESEGDDPNYFSKEGI